MRWNASSSSRSLVRCAFLDVGAGRGRGAAGFLPAARASFLLLRLASIFALRSPRPAASALNPPNFGRSGRALVLLGFFLPSARPFASAPSSAASALFTDCDAGEHPVGVVPVRIVELGKSCGFCTSSSVSPGLRRRARSSTFFRWSSSRASSLARESCRRPLASARSRILGEEYEHRRRGRRPRSRSRSRARAAGYRATVAPCSGADAEAERLRDPRPRDGARAPRPHASARRRARRRARRILDRAESPSRRFAQTNR